MDACLLLLRFSFSVLSQEIGWEERLRNDLFVSGGTSNLNSINQSGSPSQLFVSGPCARLSWPSRQLLSARKSTVSYRIVSYCVCRWLLQWKNRQLSGFSYVWFCWKMLLPSSPWRCLVVTVRLDSSSSSSSREILARMHLSTNARYVYDR